VYRARPVGKTAGRMGLYRSHRDRRATPSTPPPATGSLAWPRGGTTV